MYKDKAKYITYLKNNKENIKGWQKKAYQRKVTRDPDWYRIRKTTRTNHRRAKKVYWVNKLGGRCIDCRGKFHPAIYDFHHRRKGTKDPKLGRSTNQIFMLRNETIAKELKKCVLICANCHRLRHVKTTWPGKAG